MRRIAIVGNAGGGKSTLARRLGVALAIPVYEIDLLQCKPGWVLASSEEIGQAHDSVAGIAGLDYRRLGRLGSG
jgi:adenylate kinase family enzyme